MPLLRKASAGLRHTQPAATLALYISVWVIAVFLVYRAAARGVSALRSACRTPALGQWQTAALRRIARFSGPVGTPGFLAECGLLFQRFLERRKSCEAIRCAVSEQFR